MYERGPFGCLLSSALRWERGTVNVVIELELVCVIAALVIMFYVVAVYYQNEHIIHLIVYTVIGFFSLYILVSGVFFFFDKFQMRIVLACCLVIELAAAALSWKLGRRWKTVVITQGLQGYSFVLCMAVLAVILSAVKYEFYGMGQDEGVYQTKAIEIMYHTSKNQMDFEEYYNLTEEADKQLYREMIPQFIGFYTSPTFPTFTPEDKLGDVSGYYHGIPTFPAMLALFGTCFGLSNMSQFQTVFFVCSLLLLFLGCSNLKLRPCTTNLLLFLYTISPAVLWVSKSALTEPFLGVLLIWFFYLATSQKVTDRHLLFIPILVFSIYHITCYTLMPMFLCIFVVKYVYTKEKEYLVQGGLSTISFLAGYVVACIIAPQYSYGNSVHITGGFVNYSNLLWVVGGVCLVIIIGLFIFGKLNLTQPLEKFFKSTLCHRIYSVATVVVLVYIVYYGYTIGWGAEPEGIYPYYGSGLNVYFYLTITAFTLVTGLIIIPLSLVLTIKNAKKVLENERVVVLAIGFAYLCLFMSCFLRRETAQYYYYSRYLAPFIAPILLYCGIMIDQIRAKYLCIIGVLSAAVLMPFDYVLATQKDDSRLSWDILEDIQAHIGENDAIITEPKFSVHNEDKASLLAVRAMTGADLYIYTHEAFPTESMLNLLQEYDNVYYIGNKIPRSTLVYSRTDVVSQDLQDTRSWILPLPSSFTQKEREVMIWKLDLKMFDPDTEQLEYLFGDNENFMLNNFWGNEGTFRWTKEESEFYAALNGDCDYEMKISLGSFPPLELAGRDSLEVSVLVNGQAAGTFVLSTEAPATEFTVEINRELLADGLANNRITFVSEVWTPASYGSADTRYLGILIEKITFDPDTEQLEYPFGVNENFETENFHGNEGTFRWTQEESSFYAALNGSSGYEMKIRLGSFPPLELAGRDSLEVSVLVNGQAAGTFVLSTEAPATEFTVEINRELLADGLANNRITFVSEVWTPASYGSADTRYLGIPIEEVTFERIEAS